MNRKIHTKSAVVAVAVVAAAVAAPTGLAGTKAPSTAPTVKAPTTTILEETRIGLPSRLITMH